jgi:hypothetical protein
MVQTLDRSEGFEAIDGDDYRVLSVIFDSPIKKIYIIQIGNKQYVWKYNREIDNNTLHAFCHYHTKIQHKNIVPIVGTLEIDEMLGHISPFIDGEPLNKWRNNNSIKKSLLYQIIDATKYAEDSNIFIYPIMGNIIIDKKGVPHILDYVSRSISLYIPHKVPEFTMRYYLVNTLLALYYNLPEARVPYHIDRIVTSDRIRQFVKGRIEIDYQHIVEWLDSEKELTI